MNRYQALEMTIAEIENRIAVLKGTPRQLIGSDSGTHGQPDCHNIYEEITGERYATYSFANSNASRCSIEQAHQDTHGRIRMFASDIKKIAALRLELAKLEDKKAKMVRNGTS